MPMYYLSFAAPDRSLGATVVAADDEYEAIRKTHRLKINPGGEVMMVELPEELETEPEIVACLNRLVSREECEKLGAKRIADMTPEELERHGFAELADQPDDEPDTSDIPETGEKLFLKAALKHVMLEVAELDLPDGAHWMLIHERLGLPYGTVFEMIAEDPAFFGASKAVHQRKAP
jgi:hypothetical protein